MSVVVSRHKDRVVTDEGDRFRKEFLRTKDRDDELARLRRLAEAGVAVPEVLSTEGNTIVTRRLDARPLDEIVRTEWTAMRRKARTALIERVAAVCRRIRDAGLDWPDLVTYHVWIGDGEVSVIDPARLRAGRLDLSPLYWSTEEPTVSRSDRLRFWRAYAGDTKPPRLRAIGHRGRFRPFRWAVQKTAIRPLPPWGGFVNAVDAPYGSADEVLRDPRFTAVRTLKDRVNARVGDYVVKVLRDPREAAAEWENHRMLMAAGFRVPQPAVGGVLADGRGLFATVRLDGLHPMDDVWDTLDPRAAVRAAADVARRLHACGLVHRDLYLCHLFVAKGGDELTLIDLARLARTRSRRRRIKDLAALVHSARGLATRTQMLRGLRRYGGDRRLAKAVWKKAARIARHVPKNVRDGTHETHVPCT